MRGNSHVRFLGGKGAARPLTYPVCKENEEEKETEEEEMASRGLQDMVEYLETIYLETSIPSYLATRPSKDLIIAAHQQLTHEWWDTLRSKHRLYISEAVLREIRDGDPKFAERRLSFLKDIPILEMNDDVRALATEYKEHLGLTGRAQLDVPHIAFSVAHDMDYLLTWNCSHIANPLVIRRLMKINNRLTRQTPVILTPEDMLAFPEEA